MIKKILSSVFLATLGFLFLGNAALAQEIGSPEIYTDNLQLNKTNYKAGETVAGSFSLINARDFGVPNLYYTVSLVGNYKNSIATIQYNSSKMIGPVLLGSRETQKIDFTYKLPESVSGKDLGIQVRAMLDTGASLGWADSMITVVGGLSMINITEQNISIGKDKFGLQEGPMVYQGQTPMLNLVLKNPTSEKVTLTPKINIYDRSDAKELLSSYDDVVVTIPANASLSVNLKLPVFEYTPRVYVGTLNLIDQTGAIRTVETAFRYIVFGEVVTIHSLTANKINDTVNLKLNYTGSPVDILNETSVRSPIIANLGIKLFNEKDTLVGEYSEMMDFNIGEQKDISLKLTGKVEALRADLVVTKDNKTLANFTGTIFTEPVNNETSSIFSGKMIVWLVVLILIIAIITMIILKKRKTTTILFLLFLFLFSPFVWNSKAEAYDIVYNSLHKEGDVGTPKVTVNAPKPSSIRKYSPGEAFNFQGTISVRSCGNRSMFAKIYTSPILGKDAPQPVIPTPKPYLADLYQNFGDYLSLLRTEAFKGYSDDYVTRNFDFATGELTAPEIPGFYRIYLGVEQHYRKKVGGIYVPGAISAVMLGYQEFLVFSPINLVASAADNCGGLVHLSWGDISSYGSTAFLQIYKNSIKVDSVPITQTSIDLVGTGTDEFNVRLGYYVGVGSDYHIEYSDYSNTVSSTPSAPCGGGLPVVTFSANPTIVAYNGSTTLTWNATNPNPVASQGSNPFKFASVFLAQAGDPITCTATGDWNLLGAKQPSGSEVQNNITTDKLYTLACHNSIGTTTPDDVMVTVLPPSLSVSCSVNPTTAIANTPVTWTAVPSNGIPPYTYEWSGSVGGGGISTTTSYSTTGEKEASVKIIDSTNASSTTSCSNTVVVSSPVLVATCITSGPDYSHQDEGRISRSVSVSNATGLLYYSWSLASESESSTDNSANVIQYMNANDSVYNASVVVTDSAGSVTASCETIDTNPSTPNPDPDPVTVACSIAMVPSQKDKVNINTSTHWKILATPPELITNKRISWIIIGDRGELDRRISDNNELDYTFRSIGIKTLTASVETTPGKFSQCQVGVEAAEGSTEVVRTGGWSGEF